MPTDDTSLVMVRMHMLEALLAQLLARLAELATAANRVCAESNQIVTIGTALQERRGTTLH